MARALASEVLSERQPLAPTPRRDAEIAHALFRRSRTCAPKLSNARSRWRSKPKFYVLCPAFLQQTSRCAPPRMRACVVAVALGDAAPPTLRLDVVSVFDVEAAAIRRSFSEANLADAARHPRILSKRSVHLPNAWLCSLDEMFALSLLDKGMLLLKERPT